MRRLTEGLPTKSAKIRKLGEAGYTRQQIADFLGIRYQHVRNVLLDAERKRTPTGAAKEPPGFAEERPASSTFRRGDIIQLSAGADGSLFLPADFVAAAGFAPTEGLTARIVDDGHIELVSPEAGLRRAQELLRQLVPPDVDLVDELIAERRHEAARENEEFLAYERALKAARRRKKE